MTKAVAKDISKVKNAHLSEFRLNDFRGEANYIRKTKEKTTTDLQKNMIRKAKEADKFKIV